MGPSPYLAGLGRFQRTDTERSVCVFSGMTESFDPMWSLSCKSLGRGTASRTPSGSRTAVLSAARTAVGYPSRSLRARARLKSAREAHAPPIVSMSSGRLFLDRVGRHQSPSPLHRRSQRNTASENAPPGHDISTLRKRRHFYFALTAGCKRLTGRPDA